MTISNEQTKLYDTAREAITHSYSPHSKFALGAALLTEGGDSITGCNIQNASYGLTMCAERVAVFKAVSEGHQNFKAIASESEANCPPCGACLQIETYIHRSQHRLVPSVDNHYRDVCRRRQGALRTDYAATGERIIHLSQWHIHGSHSTAKTASLPIPLVACPAPP